MELEVSDDTDIDKLLELRNKLMSQLQKTESNRVPKAACPFRCQKRRLNCENVLSTSTIKCASSLKRPRSSSDENSADHSADIQKTIFSENTGYCEENSGQASSSRPSSSNERSWSSFSNDTNTSSASKNREDISYAASKTVDSLLSNDNALSLEVNASSPNLDTHRYQVRYLTL
ncbi:unnamed protein product [Enterobius vermicularis]|uniref:SCHIP-1 domain-containing protein n=1 Tax=Enterobius vermicularis TaxID=51028 RepID=A0A0N4VAD1_ENTVE|nr:unnamed protein product [Enterobius vermicularis]